MLVNDDSIISYRENERERKEEVDDKIKNEEIKDNENISYKEANIENKNDDKKGIRNVIYIDVRVRLCAATPPSIIANRTPPSASQKHHFTQKHQINFCIDENHRAPSRRESADAVP